MAAITNDWLKPLKAEFAKEYYKNLYKNVVYEYSNTVVYPPSDDIFNAFHYTPLSEVKVVILGQDPYHEPGQAHGLCFSVKEGVQIPPSLVNIYKELHNDLGCYIPDNGYLVKWAKQGILLLNSVLTVRAHNAFSHKNIGWEQFTDAVIDIVNSKEEPVVFMLWGNAAIKKAEKVDRNKHYVLTAPHPSPLSASRGFFGCKHFSMCNDFLLRNGKDAIDWQIDNLK